MPTDTLQHAFASFLAEALVLGIAFFLVSAYAGARPRGGLRFFFLAGLLAGLGGGAIFGFLGLPAGEPLRQTWITLSLGATVSLLIGSVVLGWFDDGHGLSVPDPVWVVLGVLVSCFDGGAAGAVLKDYVGSVPGDGIQVVGAAAAGAGTGALPFFLLDRHWRKLNWGGVMTLPVTLLALGTLGTIAGGVGDFGDQDLLAGLYLGMTEFAGRSVAAVRRILLLEPHAYLDVPWEGLFAYLGGERVGMSLAVGALFFPPAFLLVRTLAAPDPVTSHLEAGAQRRRAVALFRQDLLVRMFPVLLCFVLTLVQVHAANLRLNPLFDPQPAPVMPDDAGITIRIPLEDRLGSFQDGKLRKYVYNYGDKRIVFLAIMGPDGDVRTCLDECEICVPAEWNRKAQGYAQRGKNLVCKYCVTPIPVQTVGRPGGCNPIPFPSTADGEFLYVSVDELIRTWKKLQAMERRGTHF